MGSVRDDAPPWSFFLPVTLAVVVGVLAADAIRYAIGTVFGTDAPVPAQVEPAPGPTAEAPPAPADPETATQPVPAPAAGEDDPPVAEPAAPDPASPDDAASPPTAAAADGVLELPDPITARREGAEAACVNGTVANRVAGGWEQALENDAPVRCVVVSN